MPELKQGRYQRPSYDLWNPLDPKATRGEGAVQCACYALEVLSGTSGSRASCFGIVVVDDLLSFWHYDASSIVYTTQKLSFLLDFEGAAAAILAVANCTAERFGALPSSVMKPPQPYPESFPPRSLHGYSFSMASLDNRDTFNLKLQDPVNVSYCLTGRRSFIYTAEIDPIPAGYPQKTVIVKFSYQVNTRKPEDQIVTLARNHGISHIPDIHAYQDLWVLEDGARVADERIRAAMEKYGLASEDPKKTYEDRVFRAIAYTAYDPLRNLFSERWELIPIMVDQMIDCE